MFKVNVKRSGITVCMNGADYALPMCYAAEFRADLGWYDSLKALVEKYLSKLQRVISTIKANLWAMAFALADADNYRRGVGAATANDVRRYL